MTSSIDPLGQKYPGAQPVPLSDVSPVEVDFVPAEIGFQLVSVGQYKPLGQGLEVCKSSVPEKQRLPTPQFEQLVALTDEY